jgi:acetylornithine deacetylase
MSSTSKAIGLLKQLITTPSFSKEEGETKNVLLNFFKSNEVNTYQLENNVWALNLHFDPAKPTILLNSHHDTVKPNQGYTNNPFEAIEKDGKLYGLGSNDAGACLVSLIAAFLHFYSIPNLSHNLCMLCTAEEEISGPKGMDLVKNHLPPISFALVGEPTLLDAAIAEKGLIVVDCYAKGKAGHAAREEGENALYKAVDDITWIKTFEFPKLSKTLGKVKMSATVIEAGKQHNVVPDSCHFVLDIRVTDAYTNQEIIEILKQNLRSEVIPRSLRLSSSGISENHPLVQAAVVTGSKTYGSPTLSDQALLTIPSLKMGPGDSARSHTADEFIYLDEIQQGIQKYISCLEKIL